MRILILVLILGISVTAASEEAKGDAKDEAKGDAKAGAGKVAVCVACHGEGGKKPAAPIYPRLAGQTSEYLASSLIAYREGQRQGGMAAMMSPQAATLSDEDIADIAAYYAQVKDGPEAEAEPESK